MNKVVLIGRLTKDPETRYTQEGQAIARYTLAVDRYSKNEKTADFIQCVAFGKTAEFADKYLKKGTKIAVEGSIKTGSYTNKDGVKVYTTDVIVNAHDFCESRHGGENGSTGNSPAGPAPDEPWLNIPDNIDEELPFN